MRYQTALRSEALRAIEFGGFESNPLGDENGTNGLRWYMVAQKSHQKSHQSSPGVHGCIALALIALLLIVSPAFSDSRPACVIVIAADRASTTEIYRHELAHCNGWVHPDQHPKGQPRKGYKSPKPPEQFVRPYPGNLVDHWVTTDEALRICGSYGCQWFEAR